MKSFLKPSIFSFFLIALAALVLAPLNAQEPEGKKKPKEINPEHLFEYRFDEDLKQP